MSHEEEKPTVRKTLSRRQFLKGASAIGLSLPILAACVPTAPATPAAPSEAQAVQPTAAPAAAEAVSLQYWDMVWGPPEYVDTGKKLIDKYNSEQNKAKVTYQSTPWANWYQTFLTAIGSGTAPDISTGAGYQAVYFYSQGAIEPIDDVIADLKSSGKADDVITGGIDTLQWDNHYVAIPWNTDIRTVVYRKDLLEKAGITAPPTSWAEFQAQAKQLTTGDQVGFVVQGNETGGTHILFMLMFNNAGGWFTPDRKVDTMYDRNVEAMQYFSDLVKSGVVHKGSAGFTGDDALESARTGRRGVLHCRPEHARTCAEHRNRCPADRPARRQGHDLLDQQPHDLQAVEEPGSGQRFHEVAVRQRDLALERGPLRKPANPPVVL